MWRRLHEIMATGSESERIISRWIKAEPAFGAQAVYLDDRYSQEDADEGKVDPMDPATFKPSMQELSDMGVNYVAPPIWMLLTLENGNQFEISAPGNGKGRPYIRSARLNEATLDKTWIDHREILEGGKLAFDISGKPDFKWATGDDSVPFSMSNNQTK